MSNTALRRYFQTSYVSNIEVLTFINVLIMYILEPSHMIVYVFLLDTCFQKMSRLIGFEKLSKQAF